MTDDSSAPLLQQDGEFLEKIAVCLRENRNLLQNLEAERDVWMQKAAAAEQAFAAATGKIPDYAATSLEKSIQKVAARLSLPVAILSEHSPKSVEGLVAALEKLANGAPPRPEVFRLGKSIANPVEKKAGKDGRALKESDKFYSQHFKE